jgi:hypothetical protein
MRSRVVLVAGLLVLLPWPAAGQEVTAAAGPGEDLDLHAVIELFKESESIEEFEQKLNDPDVGVNNLDLNEDGEVDFIRVMEYTEGDANVFVLQAALGEDTYQDVARVMVEKVEGEEIVAEVQGDEELYGEGYVIAPTTVIVVTSFALLGVIFRPRRVVYRSPWGWRRRPPWWRPFPPVVRATYRSRTARYRQARGSARRSHTRARKADNVYRTQRRRSGPGSGPGPSWHHSATPPSGWIERFAANGLFDDPACAGRGVMV